MIDPPTTRSEGGPYLPDAAWSIPQATLVFAVGVVGSVIGVGLVAATNPTDLTLLSAGLIAQAVASVAILAYLSSTRGTGEWDRDYGLRIDPRHIGWLAGGFALQIVVALIVAPIVELLAPEDAPQQSVAEIAETLEGGGSTLLFLFLVVIVAPLVEEIIFRGMLLSRLRRSMGKWAAIVVSAAVFAGIHLIDPNAIYAVPGLFLVGIALGWAALRYGDLSVPIFLHAGVNLTGAIFLFLSDDILDSIESMGALL